jgi:hypothetical protein
MALLSYEMIKEIRGVADEYREIERARQAEAESRRGEPSSGAATNGSARRAPRSRG